MAFRAGRRVCMNVSPHRYHFSFFYVSMKEHLHLKSLSLTQNTTVRCVKLGSELFSPTRKLLFRLASLRSYLIIRSPPTLLLHPSLPRFPVLSESSNLQNHLQRIKSHLSVVFFCELRKVRCSSLCHAPTTGRDPDEPSSSAATKTEMRQNYR